MKPRFLALILCTVVVLGATGPTLADEAKKPEAKKAAAATPESKPAELTPEQKAMMQFVEQNKPGDAQKMISSMEGDWNLEVKSWMAPGAAPTVSKGTATCKMILDGRYLEENVSGDMMGSPFAGRSLLAYDNIKKKYMSTWVDNMSTSILQSEGTYDPATKTFTMNAMSYEPMAGKDVPVKMVTKIVDEKTHTFEWWAPGPKGDLMKGMEITYTRK